MTTQRRSVRAAQRRHPAAGQTDRAAPIAVPEPVASRAGAARSQVAARLCALVPGPWSLALLAVALLALAPLLRPGYFWGAHDARHDVYFLFQYDLSVQEGNWFPRWGPDWAFGYGYPFWIIYAPLAVFLGELAHHFLGLGWESSVKTVFALSFVLSGLSMYAFVRSWLGRQAGLVAGAAYMLIPYHLVDVYVRAALPESLALAILPLVLWGFRAAALRPRLMAVIGAAFAYAALWWTHNLTAAVFTPALAVYVLALLLWRTGVSAPRRARALAATLSRLLRSACAPAAALGLALGLSAAFLIPALLEARNVNQAQWFGLYYNPFQHFVYFNQLFNPAWGTGISAPGPDDVVGGSLSYQLGAVPVLLGLIAVVTAGRLGRAVRRELWLLALFAAGAIFLTLDVSAHAWRLPFIPYAQFPWRYLLVAIPFLSILAGAVLAPAPDEPALPSREAALPGRQPPRPDRGSEGRPPAAASVAWPAVLLACLVALGSYPYLRVEMRAPAPDQGPVSYAALMRFQRTSNEMTGVTAWVDAQQIPTWSPMADVWLAGKDVTTKVDYGQVPQNETLAVNAEGLRSDAEEVWYHAGEDGQAIVFNRFWYPGWRAYLLDGKHGRPVQELPLLREDGALARIRVPVPRGESYLLLRFEDTLPRAIARGITLASLALVIILLAARVVINARRPHSQPQG